MGFSLSGPNFDLIHDDIRPVYGMNLPASYAVQGRRSPSRSATFADSGVNAAWLVGWNDMPDFLTRINPSASDQVSTIDTRE